MTNSKHQKKTPLKAAKSTITLIIVIVIASITIKTKMNQRNRDLVATISTENTFYNDVIYRNDENGSNKRNNDDLSDEEGYCDYTEFVPQSVSLLNLSPYTGMPFTEATYEMEDIFSNSYSTSIYSSCEQEDGICYASYVLDNEYEFKYLEFYTGIVSYGRGAPGEALIRICGDDNEVLYERTLTCESSTDYVLLDIEDVSCLTIQLYGVSEPEISLMGSTALWPALFEPTLYTQ